MTRSLSGAWATMGAAVLLVAPISSTSSDLHAQSPEERVDALFARWDDAASPGCAVGVDRGNEALVRSAYGMAELEWGMPNAPETIFENGSVSKQFTAGAIVLLALDGKLSLEDDVRKYIPELPDYPETITLRHMLNHTSGLRDWGAVAGLSGWGRSRRTHSHEDVLDILSRQSALNFVPGHEYSYSNSGYNLLTVVVSRVSGMSFSEFSDTRIFEPLGMTNTQWRDDYTRIVPGRSAAYTANRDGSFSINRPIENVHGNGGLLTTVGDLLRWNRSLDEASLAGPEFVAMMETQGVLNDGRTIGYALGLDVSEAFGLRTVMHGGATSGYRAGLVRFPGRALNVAVLCNVTNANAVRLSMDAAEIFLGDAVQEEPEPELATGIRIDPEALASRAGLYISAIRPANGRLTVGEDGRLRQGGSDGTVLIPRSDTEFEIAGEEGTRIVFEGPPTAERVGFEVQYDGNMIDAFVPMGDWEPAAEDLQDFVGIYASDDADISFSVEVVGERLMGTHPVHGQFPLNPVYEDAFRGGPGVFRFRRLMGGQVHEFGLAQPRVYDMRFTKTH